MGANRCGIILSLIVALLASGTVSSAHAQGTTPEERALQRIRDATASESSTLNLSRLGLTTLPPEIEGLSSLERLYARGNEIEELPPEIGELTSLQLLDLRWNSLTALPSDIGKLTNLEVLHLEGNAISELPPEIGQISSLRELYLGDNQLQALPQEIGLLANLRVLELSGNPIPSVQELNGSLNDTRVSVDFEVPNLSAGQILYIYAESDKIDTFITVSRQDIRQALAEDDDSGEGTNSALEFVILEDGDYRVTVSDCCDEVSGEIRLLIGLNAPDVLMGTAIPNTQEIVAVIEQEEVSSPVPITDCRFLADRPELSGPELTRETENFIIHYTDQGRDGATPNYVDEVEQILEEALQTQTTEMGWPLPVLDCGEGGDERFDIYLIEIADNEELGRAVPEAYIGDNPNSPLEEIYSAYGHLIIDNNFAGLGAPRRIMRSTIAHEVHHVIQFGFDAGHDLLWYYEATSSWMETQTFPHDETAFASVPGLFRYPDLCIGATPDNPDIDFRIYGEWLLLASLVQDYGAGTVQSLWGEIAREDGMAAFYRYLDRLETSPQTAVQRFAVRNLLRDYDLGYRFPELVVVEANINGVGDVVPRRTGVQELGVDYLLITERDVYTFSIDQPNLSLAVVGIDQPRDEARVFELGQQGTVDTAAFTNAYVLILNTNVHEDPESCTMTDWTLRVTDGRGEPLITPIHEIFDAAEFIPAG